MGANNKAEKLSILLPDGKGLWVPIDHAVTNYPIKGLTKIEDTINLLSNVDAIVAHKGVVSHFASELNPPFVMHISASTIHAGDELDNKMLVGSVKEAISRGAIGVSVQVNLGSSFENIMLERLGMISDKCNKLGVPLLGMMYARGPNLKIDDNDVTKGVAHAVRVGWELGCDIVKTTWTGDAESFKMVTSSVPIPVLVAGGENKSDFTEVLEMAKDAIKVGAAGLCMGRQIFEAEDVEKRIELLNDVLRGD